MEETSQVVSVGCNVDEAGPVDTGQSGRAEFQKTPGASLLEMGVGLELPPKEQPNKIPKAGKPGLLLAGGQRVGRLRACRLLPP